MVIPRRRRKVSTVTTHPVPYPKFIELFPGSARLTLSRPFSHNHIMSRLAYYPTPANRRLGAFTLDACPPLYSTLSHSFMISQTAKRWSGSLGLWGVGAGTALVFVRAPQTTCCTLFLLNVFSLAPLRDTKDKKHPASQDTCRASLASPHVRFLDYMPFHSSANTTRTKPLLQTSRSNCCFL